jgi:hypothetical protein
MDGTPRRRLGPALIASSFAGQAAILAAIITLLLAPSPSPASASANGWLTTAPAVIGPPLASEFTANIAPMYYAALTGPSAASAGPDYIAVRRSSSGAVAATVQPPPGMTFSMVTATSEAEEFLVAAQRRQPSGAVNAAPVDLYVLQLGTPPEDVTLSPLPVPTIPAAQFWSAILSPDGSKLAVALTAGPVGRGAARPEVRVYPLAGGTATTWSATAPGQGFNGPRQDPALLSWSADGRLLGVNWRGPVPGLRVLNTEAPGGSLLAASRMITLPEGQPATTPSCDSDALLTASAAMVVCAGHGASHGAPDGQAFPSSGGSPASLLRFDATTGHPLSAIVPPTGVGGKPVREVRLLWVSPSGHGFIVASYTGSAGPTAVTALNEPVRLASSLPLSPDVTEWAW